MINFSSFLTPKWCLDFLWPISYYELDTVSTYLTNFILNIQTFYGQYQFMYKYCLLSWYVH